MFEKKRWKVEFYGSPVQNIKSWEKNSSLDFIDHPFSGVKKHFLFIASPVQGVSNEESHKKTHARKKKMHPVDQWFPEALLQLYWSGYAKSKVHPPWSLLFSGLLVLLAPFRTLALWLIPLVCGYFVCWGGWGMPFEWLAITCLSIKVNTHQPFELLATFTQ